LRKLLAPEVVQTSSLDCGPAALKCLLEGFGAKVSYGRLREACQTGLDGTSIDTMETVANQLGLEAEQIMLPVDHLLLPEAKALPAIVVVTLANGLTHFVVVWRRFGNWLQVMDPAVGRRWISCTQFDGEVYSHSMAVDAADWREFAVSDDFQLALRARWRGLGIRETERARLTEEFVSQEGWRGLAALDAGTRLLTSLARAGGLPGKRQIPGLLKRLCSQPTLIPRRCWTVVEGADEQVLMRGAVLVRVKGKRTAEESTALRPELAAAIEAPAVSPGRELGRALLKSGTGSAALLLVALAAAAGGTLIEALLFRGLLDINGILGLAGQRMAAAVAVLLFCLALVVLELASFATGARLGRQLENRLRVLFLEKVPKLGDRYFRSRPTSDMAERSHATHRLRHLPDQARQLLSVLLQLAATGAGIIWLDPKAAPFVLAALAAAVLPVFGAQAVLVERDLRTRTHSAGLTRFYLDAMLGLLAIRAHGAERTVRQEQEELLGDWAEAAVRLQHAVVRAEALQLVSTFGLIIALLLTRPLEGSAVGQVLLVAYWALNLPVLGQELATLARQYPAYRNLTLRLLDPLGAPEEQPAAAGATKTAQMEKPPAIRFQQVSAEVSGHSILRDISLEIEAGAHVAIVGPSGAGKSSLAGVLLGWLKPSAGEVLVNGAPLDCEQLRDATAWVDPAVQLWNRSLFANLTYGTGAEAGSVGDAIDAATLRGVVEGLPQGLRSELGEGGALVSGGEGQRVRFGRALLRKDVKLAILDEPFRGLDRERRRELLGRARECWRGSTMLCITHDLAETQAFDWVVVVENGSIAEQGDPRALGARAESRYSQLLEAEEQGRRALWLGNKWRRIRIQAGKIVEEKPRTAVENRQTSEVA
jgi:ATP-binding cassette subfamily B protein